jgi:phenylacetate-CoA ligase
VEFYDALETRASAERESALMAALPQIIAEAKERSPACRQRLAAVHPEDVRDRRALAELPLTRKSELIELQRQAPPFGGFVAAPISALRRVFMSPGPIYEPEGRRPDYWRFARALFAAGFRAGDLVHNSFSYHLTPAGAMVESGAEALGCPVIPAGTGQTEQQLRVIADLRPVGYVGTPSFLKVLLDRAASLGSEISSIRKALVGGKLCLRRCAPNSVVGGSACCSAMGLPISGSSRMRQWTRMEMSARAWCWTKASSSNSCFPAPANRFPRARSARSS